ncbi:equilibrative nucleoside transporter 1-like [Liolophura sinensis]|uniref:equilibrative nucleoside transporter 1-like n=1 Tax=Liolophura sinensis TaxID=3198878 RepID=UPI00315873F7
MKLSANAGAVIKEKRKRPLLHTFKQVWMVALSVWLVYFSSAVIYPSMMANTSKIDPQFPLPDVYWKPVFGLLVFPAFALLGNLLTFFVNKPGPQFLWIACLLRAVLSIPFFLLCNFRADTRSLSVLITNDYAFLAGGALFGMTHGYMGALGMMYGPERVEIENASSAGMFMSVALSLGILCGTNFSMVVKFFVENAGG